MKKQVTSFSQQRLDALISKINSNPALLEQDWRDIVRSNFPLLPDEERTLAHLSPEKVKHIQDYLSEAAVRHKKGGKFTGRLVERGPHERADGLVYDIEVDVVPATRAGHPKV